ncbi:MAG TPA: GreA/GreB family elongation factor [Candidatus Paceibacterota bacterium]
MPYYFLAPDLVSLEAQIDSLRQRIREAGSRKSASVQGGDTFHDNGAFEEAEREQQMWSTRLHELVQIRNGARVATSEISKKDSVRIGSEVVLRDNTAGETLRLKIGSFMTFDDDPNVMSYNSPLARLIIGAKVNEVRTGHIADQKKEFCVLEIK